MNQEIKILRNSTIAGGGVETAFDTFFNEQARRIGLEFELHNGNMAWKGASPSPDGYV